MKYFLGIILFVYTLNVFAQAIKSAQDTVPAQIIKPTETEATKAVTVPQSCTNKGFTVDNKQFIFNSDENPVPRIYILHNISQGIVMLSHVKSVIGAGAQQSKLDQDKWAIVSVNDNNFSLGCMLYKPPNIGYVDCPSVVSVCSIPSPSLGSFWIAENDTLANVLNKARGRGAPV
ncbi:MAG TPA: hypothetical protein VGV92_07450 [Gammaproteobacteria bacterium]|nr:hypothetical protein [Gammaproteobacteria bacterium]